tara:strand:+ start:330 stop:545 length:216 start_codon:yes stop_codon:yes gene_type:complete
MNFNIGDKVYLIKPLPYLKTADPMPMLRPPDLVSPEEIGDLVALEAFEMAKVRFRKGTFLIPLKELAKISN